MGVALHRSANSTTPRAAPFIGTAGWTIPRDAGEAFAGIGTHLERYARVLGGMEINSSFHRPHRDATWLRWAASVPPGFRFAVKAPKAITHTARLAGVAEALAEFLRSATLLGERLGPLLFQLPPKLAFDERTAEEFLIVLRDLHTGPVALEPRHAGWFTADCAAMLRHYEIARVAADPARVPEAAKPGGWPGLVYLRLHGSPRTYYSAYAAEALRGFAATIEARPKAEVWVIFDNTAAGAALPNALELMKLIGPSAAV